MDKVDISIVKNPILRKLLHELYFMYSSTSSKKKSSFKNEIIINDFLQSIRYDDNKQQYYVTYIKGSEPVTFDLLFSIKLIDYTLTSMSMTIDIDTIDYLFTSLPYDLIRDCKDDDNILDDDLTILKAAVESVIVQNKLNRITMNGLETLYITYHGKKFTQFDLSNYETITTNDIIFMLFTTYLNILINFSNGRY
jgi:hypothetical protein